MSNQIRPAIGFAGEDSRNKRRIRLHAPASIQVRPSSESLEEWKVVIPLLSPIHIMSVPFKADLRPTESVSMEGEILTPPSPPPPAAGGFVIREWRHPAEPFYYEPAQANTPAFTVSRCS